MMSKKTNYSSEFKLKVALDALKGELTVNQITSKHGVHATQINKWKQLLKQSSAVIYNKDNKVKDESELIDELYKTIGKLKIELDWLKKKTNLFC